MKDKLVMQVSPQVLRSWQAISDPIAKLRLCKRHPGITNVGVVRLPAPMVSAISATLQNFDYSRLAAKVPWFVERFRSAALPMEAGDVERVKKTLEKTKEFQTLRELDTLDSGEADSNMEGRVASMSAEERDRLKAQMQNRLRTMLATRVKQQEALKITVSGELDLPIVYLLTRAAPNYASVYRVLTELKQRADSEWRPNSVLDYSSRCGTTSWVTDELWPKSITQHLLCDTSSAMHDLATLIFKNGNENSSRMRFQGVTCRTFLPLHFERSFDLVMCAYSLVDLPNLKTRLQTIATMWQAVSPGGYLVVIERGTRSGFQAVAEVRAFLINLFANLREKVEEVPATASEAHAHSSDNEDATADQKAKRAPRKRSQFDRLARHFEHVFAGQLVAPCPHSTACPRFAQAHGGGHIPCSFPVQHYSLELSRGRSESVRTEQFSYLVFRKAQDEAEHARLLQQAVQIGSPTEGMQTEEEATHKWPRVLQPALLRHNHTHVKMCCPDGDIRHMVITRGSSHPSLYKFARYSDVGDQLPVTFSKRDAQEPTNEKAQKTAAKEHNDSVDDPTET